VQVPWGLTVSNTGNVKLSVTEYSISSGQSPNGMTYTGIDGGMLSQDGKGVALPLTMEPGDSRVLTIYVGILVPPKVHELLSAITDSRLKTVSQATKALAKQGLDLYGNEVQYEEYPDKSYILTVKNGDRKSQTFWYLAVTSRGSVFQTSAATYKEGN